MTGTLNNHLTEIDKTANDRLHKVVKELAKKEHTPLHYDGNIEQLEWVRLMNNYKHCAEKVVYLELIHC